jgi:hypothetical protein
VTNLRLGTIEQFAEINCTVDFTLFHFGGGCPDCGVVGLDALGKLGSKLPPMLLDLGAKGTGSVLGSDIVISKRTDTAPAQ